MARYSVEFDDFAECNMHAQAPEFAALIRKIFATAKQQIEHGDVLRDRAALLLIQDLTDIFGVDILPGLNAGVSSGRLG